MSAGAIDTQTHTHREREREREREKHTITSYEACVVIGCTKRDLLSC